MAHTDPQAALEAIQTQRAKKPLSIVTLAEPILSSANITDQQTAQARQSTASSTNSTEPDSYNLTPASLAADLAHYKDLFSKLRFSYLEQVTKEKYLRGIVGEPVTVHTSEDNADLEQKLSLMKAELQAKKRDVDTLVQNMESMARTLAGRQQRVDEGMQILQDVPGEIVQLEAELEELRRQLREKESEAGEDASDDPRMNLSLEETDRLLAEQKEQQRELDRQIEELQAQMPDQIQECDRAERELAELESRRNDSTRAAKEVRRMKEMGGRDLLEEQGRWYQSSEIILRELLRMES